MLRFQGFTQARFLKISCLYAAKMTRRPLRLNIAKSVTKSQSTLPVEMTAEDGRDEKKKPWLLVGLGNPGKLYNGTRHNVGFELIDTIAEAEEISLNTAKFKALIGKGHISDTPVILAKPQTLMNLSGNSVGPLVSYYKIPLNQVLLIFDDMDLPFAKLRLLPKGGHGGHNGMRSVIDHFKGNREFPRLRIGIGRPPGKMEGASFVLRRFNKAEKEEMEQTLQDGLEAVKILLTQGLDKSANLVNRA